MALKTTSLPPLAPKTPTVNGFKYKEQFGIVVICKDESEHKATLVALQNGGYKCKAVRV